MSDITKPTNDVSIFSQDGVDAVDVIDDSGVKRLASNDKVASWFGSTAPTVGQKTSANSIPVVIPSDQTLSVTIGNDSWQFAASQGRAYVSTFSQLNITGTAATPAFLLKNAAASGFNVRIYKLIIMTSANTASWQIYRNPTITTNGTSNPINNLKFGSAASAMTAFYTPTVSANGTLMISTQYGGSSIASQSVLEFELAPFVTQNENFLVTVANSQNNKPIDLTLWWSEETA